MMTAIGQNTFATHSIPASVPLSLLSNHSGVSIGMFVLRVDRMRAIYMCCTAGLVVYRALSGISLSSSSFPASELQSLSALEYLTFDAMESALGTLTTSAK